MNILPSIYEKNSPRLNEHPISDLLGYPYKNNILYSNKSYSNKSYSNMFDSNNSDLNISNFSSEIDDDWTPNFSSQIDIESDSIQLALNTLGMTKTEYNYMSIQDLTLKNVGYTSNSIYALNILIYYKRTSKFTLPKYKTKHENGRYGFIERKTINEQFTKTNKLDDIG